MTAFLSLLLRLFGLPGVILIGGYVFYEGLPGFARIPYLSSVPVLGDLTTGRVATVAADARAAGRDEGAFAERKIWEEARRRAEILKAQKLAEAQAKINAADQLLQEYRANDRRRSQAIRRVYEERLSDDTADPVAGCDYSQCPVPDWVRKELE